MLRSPPGQLVPSAWETVFDQNYHLNASTDDLKNVKPTTTQVTSGPMHSAASTVNLPQIAPSQSAAAALPRVQTQAAVPTSQQEQSQPARDKLTKMIRSMHREKVIFQMPQKMQEQKNLYNQKPDYGALLTKKFNSYDEELALIAREGSSRLAAPVDLPETTLSDGESISEDDDVRKLSRGRKIEESACLRIKRIEKLLATRKDLSNEERQSLRSRKNTACHREKCRLAGELRHFRTFELDLIQSALEKRGIIVYPTRTLTSLGPETDENNKSDNSRRQKGLSMAQ